MKYVKKINSVMYQIAFVWADAFVSQSSMKGGDLASRLPVIFILNQ